MNEPGPPLTLREKYAADRALADLKRETRLERASAQGYWRSAVLPGILWLAGAVAFCLALGILVLQPFREASLNFRAGTQKPGTYYEAAAAYSNGDLGRAREMLLAILEKSPKAPPAHLLMAKIELAGGNPANAIRHLQQARETSLDRKEIDAWITGLGEATSVSLPSDPPKTLPLSTPPPP